MDLADEVEVDEAVVHRRHQRVGLQDRGAGDRVVAAGRVDDDDVGVFATAPDRRVQRPLAMVLEHFVAGLRQIAFEPAHRRVAVLEIAGHGALAAVEVERADAVAGRGERDRGVDRGRRLAGAALFIGEDDEMRLGHVPPPLLFSHARSENAPRSTVYRRG